MASITKAQLTAQLEQSHVSYQRLLAAFDAMRLDFASALIQIDVLEAQAPAPKPVSPARSAYLAREQRGPSAETLAFQAKCAAAREAAMSGNRSVRV